MYRYACARAYLLLLLCLLLSLEIINIILWALCELWNCFRAGVLARTSNSWRIQKLNRENDMELFFVNNKDTYLIYLLPLIYMCWLPADRYTYPVSLSPLQSPLAHSHPNSLHPLLSLMHSLHSFWALYYCCCLCRFMLHWYFIVCVRVCAYI